MITLITQQKLTQQILANLQIVDVAVLSIVLQLVHVASGGGYIGAIV